MAEGQQQTRKIPAPLPNVETQPYWDATAEGKLFAKSTGKLLAHGTTTCLIFEA